TGRRMGRTQKWPYTGAAALPRAYLDAVVRAGGQPVIVNDARDPKQLLARVDALVLTGGPDVDPARYGEAPHPSVYGVDAAADEFECALAEAALVRSVPMLAICRGIQVLNVARGGTLHQHIADDPGVPPHGRPGEAGGAREHEVALDRDSLVAQVMDATLVNASCHHHQAIATLGDGLRVVGRAADGIVEALELDGAFLLAVQWHPEDTAADDRAQQRLFDALVNRAGG
ncbi:MAG TPA: gamma-glutamyl-gamma-aminobutyrate hydrolase family protein, partial [Acidimicrobiia bacterium]